MHKEGRFVRPFHIQDLITRGLKFDIDPHNFLLNHLTKLNEQSEVTMAILRARGAFLNRDEALFKRSMTQLSRFDLGQFSIRDSRMISAVILQQSAYVCLRSSLVQGDTLSASGRQLRSALKCCRLFLVETEPMQVRILGLSCSCSLSVSLSVSFSVWL